MDKDVVAQLKKDLTLAKKVPHNFTFASNKGKPILLLRKANKRAFLPGRFKQEAEEEAGMGFEGGSVFIGSLSYADSRFTFTVDPNASKGNVTRTKMVRGLIKLAKDTKLQHIKKARVTFPGDPSEQQGFEPPAPDDDCAAVYSRLHRVIDTHLATAIGGLVSADGDPALAKAAKASARPLRDELKAFLDGPHAERALLPGEKRKARDAAVSAARKALDDLNRTVKVLEESLVRQGSPEQDDLPTDYEPKFHPARRVSKRIDKAVSEYRKAIKGLESSDVEGRIEAVRTLRDTCLEWKRRKGEGADPEHARFVDELRADLDDQSIGLDLQDRINKGDIRLTGGDTAKGTSGSYFIGDEDKLIHDFFVRMTLESGPFALFLNEAHKELSKQDLDDGERWDEVYEDFMPTDLSNWFDSMEPEDLDDSEESQDD